MNLSEDDWKIVEERLKQDIDNGKGDKIVFSILKEQESPLCTDCGACCVNCIAYNEDNKHCKIWDYTDYTRCREFPITPLQLKLDNLQDKCRYYWEEKR